MIDTVLFPPATAVFLRTVPAAPPKLSRPLKTKTPPPVRTVPPFRATPAATPPPPLLGALR